MVVIFNLKSNKQRHYAEHHNPIIAIARNGSMIATSEEGPDEVNELTEIRIWDSKTLGTYKVIKGLHKAGVHLLKFSINGEYLVTAGKTENSPIAIYNAKNNF